MRQAIVTVVLTLFVAGCVSTAWHSRMYPDRRAVALVLHSETMRLVRGDATPKDLIPRLKDKKPLFVEDNGEHITVRDLAFTMLQQADMAELPVRSTTSKLICSCKINGKLFRFHVPKLTDEHFTTVMETIQQKH